MKMLITMRDALADEQLLGNALPGPSWEPWRILLIACAGERLTPAERKIFRTGRSKEPGHLVELFLGVIGRRGGKSKAMAVFMVWLSCCVDWTDELSLGERGVALIVAPTERQAAVTEQYVRAIIENAPLLNSLVEYQSQHVLHLKRQVGIEILAANAKWVRGITCIGVALDESAYLPSNEEAVNSDISLLEALRPTVATTGGPILMTSSPATTTGIVHSLWKKHYGPDGSPDCVVVQSDSRTMNPRIKQSTIDKAFADDATAAASEYGGAFREPLSAFMTREMVERCVERGVRERAPLSGLQYQCFVDAASGSGTDSFAACIGHRARDAHRDVVVVDCVFTQRPPFDPLAVVAALCGHLQRWGIRQVIGDNYSGNFLVSAFAKHSIGYLPSKLSASELYLAALPAFTSGTVSLLDKSDVVDQLVNLRRKIGQVGKEQVLHMRGQHDDLANALCGLIHILTPLQPVAFDFGGIGVVTTADLKGLNPAANWSAPAGDGSIIPAGDY